MEEDAFISAKQEGSDISEGVGRRTKSPFVDALPYQQENNNLGLCLVERHLTSRLLYPNPVCILSTTSIENKLNLMTCSWLTPIDNMGRFFLSMKKSRYSAKILLESESEERVFVLSVTVDGMQSLVLNIGSSSGKETDKIKANNVIMSKFGWNRISSNNVLDTFNIKQKLLSKDISQCNAKEKRKKIGYAAFNKLQFVEQSPVHIIARVTSIVDDKTEEYDDEQDTSHLKMFCEILFACTDGKIFDTNVYNSRSNLLTFFGSKKFGVVQS